MCRAGCGAGGSRGRSDLCLSPPPQNEMLNRQIQKEIWRIQDVMEGLRKNNPSRGTDTAKHRGERALTLHGAKPSMAQLGTSLMTALLEAPCRDACTYFCFSLQWPSAPQAPTAPTAPPAH